MLPYVKQLIELRTRALQRQKSLVPPRCMRRRRGSRQCKFSRGGNPILMGVNQSWFLERAQISILLIVNKFSTVFSAPTRTCVPFETQQDGIEDNRRNPSKRKGKKAGRATTTPSKGGIQNNRCGFVSQQRKHGRRLNATPISNSRSVHVRPVYPRSSRLSTSLGSSHVLSGPLGHVR